jgi:hypothetical protein
VREITLSPELFLLLQQPLAEPSGCLVTHAKILQWILPPALRTQRVLFLLCLPTQSQCPPGRVSSLTELSAILSSYAPIHWLNAHLAELHRILSDSVFFFNSQQSSPFNAPQRIRSMPTWQSSTEFSTELCLQLCFSHTALPPRYSTTLRSSFAKLLTSVLVPQHVFGLTRSIQKCILRAPMFRDRNTLPRPPGMKPQRPSYEIKQPCKCTTTTYIQNTHREHTQTSI